MPRVLLAVSDTWHVPLGESVLWRTGVERFSAPDKDSTVDMARALKPRLIILDAADPETSQVLRRMRQDPHSRDASIAVLGRALSADQRHALMDAGANAVLTDLDGPSTWDDRFEELLGVPPRSEVRVPVAITIWSRRPDGHGSDVVGVSINISVNGLLLETEAPLPIGTSLNLSFRLPTAAEQLKLTGRVVWTTPGSGTTSHSGVEFVGFHGRAMEAILSFGAIQDEPA
jgi:CheY-like chemotaxis protein/Tfp pilus assembly protein PilZ